MNTYKRHRFPPDIISYAVWLYYRFNLSHRDIEDLLAERGITVSYESIRLWCIKFGAIYTRRLKRKHRGYGDTFYRHGVTGQQQSASSRGCYGAMEVNPERSLRINCEAMVWPIES
jgi:hypothetical protein